MEAIGRGGFGVVYRGLNIETGLTVAIKRVTLLGTPKDELENIEVII
jgi:serine/threonine protein kinase